MIKMSKTMLTIFGLSLVLFAQSTSAAVVKSMRFWQSPESTRVVLDLSKAVEHEVSVLENPARIVVDIKDSQVTVDLSELEITSDLIKKVRKSTPPEEGMLRLVFDLNKKATPKSFLLKPYQKYSDRLVLDLFDATEKVIAPPTITQSKERNVIIAVDAGHGGEDPGALGPTGAREKIITLLMAKELVKQLSAKKGISAFLTRESDYYLSLRKRTEIARKKRADLFISVHADSFKSSKAKGASVWVLSTRGAKSEMARWLRQQESESELLGGVDSNLDLSSYEKPVAQVILDLQMEHSTQASITLGNEVHRKMTRAAPKMHKKRVEEAAFVVLKNPDIPSILVELGFISNPHEEKILKTSDYRRKLSISIAQGVENYLKKHAPDGTLMASIHRKNVYRVQRGDSLSQVARRFNVSVNQIKNANKLKSNVVRIGQKLIIPAAQ